MTKSISILIPCYNCRCKKLVETLSVLLKNEKEKAASETFGYEILVADDGSTDNGIIEENKQIDNIHNCRYIIRDKNAGRAAIRNFLVQEAEYDRLIFIDSDMTINNGKFIENYMQHDGDVIVGGIKTGGNQQLLKNNIRYKYEKASERVRSSQQRQTKAHKEFRTTNFLIKKDIITAHPFNENFIHYGYEDVLLGKTLNEHNIDIRHIDNPVVLDDYEDNATFIDKTEEALRTLHIFRNELKGYSTLLDYAGKISSYGLSGIISAFYRIAGKGIRRNLTGNRPILFLFNIYKLCYYISLR